MKITTIGIDLAKNVFQVHGVDERGKTELKKALKRDQMAPFFANLQSCLIGMEACGSAHHWARKLQALGHTVKPMAPQFVKAYVKTNKNDAADADAICEAVARPNMRFVPIKNGEQQAVLAPRPPGLRQGQDCASQPDSPAAVRIWHHRPARNHSPVPATAGLQEDGENGLPGSFRLLRKRLGDHLKVLDQEVAALEVQIQAWHRENAASQKLARIPGIGPITASALIASIGDARNFKDNRQLAAWLGLVPRQHSSGGKQTLLGISKRGDSHLRTLLIHGARAVIRVAERKAHHAGSWLAKVMERRNPNVAAVALANKNARIVWALLACDRDYDAEYGVPA